MKHGHVQSSHELGAELMKLGQELLRRPSIEADTIAFDVCYDTCASKKTILAFAQNLRPLVKEYSETEIALYFGSGKLKLKVSAERNTVCRMVKPAQPAEYECEPLLSAEEESQLEAQ